MALNLSAIMQLQEQPRTQTEEIRDVAVVHAARHLIARHRSGQSFDIDAFDVPHRALAEIADKLDRAGVSHALSKPLVDALRRYVTFTGGSFARAVNAKPVVIRLIVSDTLPECRFDKAMTELACIGAREARVEGAASINVRATPSGTATTSNAADVDAMFANVRGLHLWVRFDAPTRADIESLMSQMEAALAGVTQSMGGALKAEDLKKLLGLLQSQGTLTPALMELVNRIILLQEGLKIGALSGQELAEMMRDIRQLIEQGREAGLIPEALIQAAMSAVSSLIPSCPSLAAILVNTGFADLVAGNDNLSLDIQLAAILENVKALQAIEGLGDEVRSALAALVQDAEGRLDADFPDLGDILKQLSEGLSGLAAQSQVTPDLFGAIGEILPDMAVLEKQLAELPPGLGHGEAILGMLESVAEGIRDGTLSPDDLPPEILKLVEEIGGVEVLLKAEGREERLEVLEEALGNDGMDHPLSKAVHEAVLAMVYQTDLSSLSCLPPDVERMFQDFAKGNPAIIEIATTQSLIREMKTALQEMDPLPPEAAELKKAMEMLMQNGFSVLLDPRVQESLPAPVRDVIQAFSDKNMPAVEMTATQVFLKGLGRILETLPPHSPEAVEIRRMMEGIKTRGVSDVLENPPPLSPKTASIISHVLRRHVPPPGGPGEPHTPDTAKGPVKDDEMPSRPRPGHGPEPAPAPPPPPPASPPAPEIPPLPVGPHEPAPPPQPCLPDNPQDGPQRGGDSVEPKIEPEPDGTGVHGQAEEQTAVRSCCTPIPKPPPPDAPPEDRAAYEEQFRKAKEEMERGNPKADEDGSRPTGPYIRLERDTVVIEVRDENGETVLKKSFSHEEWEKQLKDTLRAEERLKTRPKKIVDIANKPEGGLYPDQDNNDISSRFNRGAGKSRNDPGYTPEGRPSRRERMQKSFKKTELAKAYP